MGTEKNRGVISFCPARIQLSKAPAIPWTGSRKASPSGLTSTIILDLPQSKEHAKRRGPDGAGLWACTEGTLWS
jgi:hypothetical protein